MLIAKIRDDGISRESLLDDVDATKYLRISINAQQPCCLLFLIVMWIFFSWQRLGGMMGCKVSGIIRLPCIIRKWTVLRSKFVHKRHMDTYEERTYVRFLEVRRW